MDAMRYAVYTRFTLTMWDVKYFYGEDWALDGAGFTLTMWDVKYVAKTDFIINNYGFTLTMWDVKLSCFIIETWILLVLP